jgi:predicted PurR-regulated permease PerM
VIIGFAVLLAIIWLASTAIITLGVGILLAVLFDAGARGLGMIVSWDRRLRLVLVFLLATLIILAAVWWGGSILVMQATKFFSAMRDMLEQANTFLSEGGSGLAQKGSGLSQYLPNIGTVFGGATTLVSGTFEFVSLTAAILFLGAFFSWEPETYKTALLSVLPKGKGNESTMCSTSPLTPCGNGLSARA